MRWAVEGMAACKDGSRRHERQTGDAHAARSTQPLSAAAKPYLRQCCCQPSWWLPPRPPRCAPARAAAPPAAAAVPLAGAGRCRYRRCRCRPTACLGAMGAALPLICCEGWHRRRCSRPQGRPTKAACAQRCPGPWITSWGDLETMYVLNKWWQWPSGPPSSEHQNLHLPCCWRRSTSDGLARAVADRYLPYLLRAAAASRAA